MKYQKRKLSITIIADERIDNDQIEQLVSEFCEENKFCILKLVIESKSK